MKKLIPLLLLLSACTPWTAPAATPDQYTNTDISGDYQSDKISFTEDTSQDGGMQTYTLTVNDQTVTGNGDNLVGYYTLVDLDNTDGIKEIAIGNYGPSSDYSTDFYYYDGKQLNFMGNIQGIPEEMQFDNQGTVTTQSRGGLLHTWYYPDQYKLSATHELVHIDQEQYEMNTPVTLKTELTLQTSSTDETPAYTLAVGDIATIVSCDNKTWCILKNAEGDEGWFAVENYNDIVGTDLTSGDVFEGLNFAD